MDAIRASDINRVRSCLAKPRPIAFLKDGSALELACYVEQPDVVRVLLQDQRTNICDSYPDSTNQHQSIIRDFLGTAIVNNRIET